MREDCLVQDYYNFVNITTSTVWKTCYPRTVWEGWWHRSGTASPQLGVRAGQRQAHPAVESATPPGPPGHYPFISFVC